MGAEVVGLVSYSITKRQTTYWDLSLGQSVTRIHFDGKEEFRFVQAMVQSFTVVKVHPVLIDYQFAWESVFISSVSAKPQELLDRLKEAITTVLRDWHGASRYLNSPDDVLGLLRGGYGLLLSAPMPISSKVCEVLTEAGVRFTHLPAGGPRWPREALVADGNFVVARSFRIEQLAT